MPQAARLARFQNTYLTTESIFKTFYRLSCLIQKGRRKMKMKIEIKMLYQTEPI